VAVSISGNYKKFDLKTLSDFGKPVHVKINEMLKK
jgi:hypothetical protein